MKFGKRILFDKPISNKEVLELHISAMHEQMQRKREEYEKTKLEQKRHSEQLLKEAHSREAQKLSEVAKRNITLAQFNEEKRLADEQQRTIEAKSGKTYKLEYFPFVSGEMLEDHRNELKSQIRGDYLQYMMSRTRQTGV